MSAAANAFASMNTDTMTPQQWAAYSAANAPKIPTFADGLALWAQGPGVAWGQVVSLGAGNVPAYTLGAAFPFILIAGGVLFMVTRK